MVEWGYIGAQFSVLFLSLYWKLHQGNSEKAFVWNYYMQMTLFCCGDRGIAAGKDKVMEVWHGN